MQRDPDDLPLFQWRPPPKVVVFPVLRRKTWIQRRARTLATYPKKREAAIVRLLDEHRSRLDGCGICPEVIDRELRDLETALRCELQRALVETGGAA